MTTNAENHSYTDNKGNKSVVYIYTHIIIKVYLQYKPYKEVYV